MKEPARPARPSLPAAGWTVRRGELVDVPAIARMLAAGAGQWAQPAVTRLVLTHVALGRGGFWVAESAPALDSTALASLTSESAVLASTAVKAAVVLLPPGDDEDLKLALQLELGTVADPPDLAAFIAVPDEFWLLLHVEPDDPRVLQDLLAHALPTAVDSGLPVLSLHAGAPSEVLTQAGFAPLPTRPPSTRRRPAATRAPFPFVAALRPAGGDVRGARTGAGRGAGVGAGPG